MTLRGCSSFLVVILVVSVAHVANAAAVLKPLACNAKDRITKDGRWEIIRAPDFTAGPQVLTDFGVDPGDPARVLVTNGVSVALSSDGGCSWMTTFSLASPPDGAGYSDADSLITDIAVAPFHVLLAISQRDGLRPHVVVSNYAGETWRRGDQGLETVVGPPLAVGFTRSDPQYAYLLLDERAGSREGGLSLRQTIMESTSAGAAWNTRGGQRPPDPALELPGGGRVGSPERFIGMVPDPVEGGRLYLYGPHGVYSYQQGSQAQLVGGDIGALEAFRPPGAAMTTLLAASRDAGSISYSSDGGGSFSSFTAPAGVDSLAEGLLAGDFYASAAGKVWLRSNGTFIDRSPSETTEVKDLKAVRVREALNAFRETETLTLYGRTENGIARTTERRTIDIPPASNLAIGAVRALDLGARPPAALIPKDARVVLNETEEASVAYVLNLPETPTPLDVFFDVDTTNSMLPAIDGLRAALADIVRELSAAGIDVWFGAGQYRGFETPPAFERLQDIAPPGPGIVEALNQMRASGGGEETQLESLRQIATGEGLGRRGGIAPGQQANWRKGSLRMVVNLTDEPISTGGPHPTFEEVAEVMIADEALHFGVAVQNEATEEGLGAPYPGLVRISRETRSVAPSEGIDCNGDGRPDLYSGEPLVCIVDHVRSRDAAVLGGAIISVLRSITDIGEIRLVTRVESSSVRAQDIAVPSISVISGVDFKTSNRIAFEVTFRCPEIEISRSFPVEIQAVREAGALASASAQVICRARPEAKSVPPIPAQMLAALPPLPPPPNPPQHPNPNPNPNPHPNPAQQSQSQAQGAVATQEEEQQQVAVAYENEVLAQAARADRPGDTEDYAMSALVTDENAHDGLFFSVAVALVAGFGTAFVFLDRPGPALVRQSRTTTPRSRNVRPNGNHR